MKVLNLTTHEGAVTPEDHKALKNAFKELGYKVKDDRHDMAAKGGYNWYPIGVVVYMAIEFLGGFSRKMGEKFADGIIKLFERIIKNGYYQKPEFCFQTNLSDNHSKIIVYFVFERDKNYSFNDIQKAMLTIHRSCENLRAMLAENPYGLIGNPHSIILKFNSQGQNWNIEALLDYDIDDYSITD